MPTQANLEFGADHAAARDAVHSVLNVIDLAQQLQRAGFQTMSARSQAGDRAEYLRRPDLGRRLHQASSASLECGVERVPGRLTVVIGDGLSAEAPQRYAVPIVNELRLKLLDWTMDSIVLAEQARVALGDEIGRLRGAEAVLVLLGERPGLKAADSLGAYLTYGPRVGLTDASRNCVSNIREGGLSISLAVTKLAYLLDGARALGRSGVLLKDNSELPRFDTSHAVSPKADGLKSLLEATAFLLQGDVS